MPIDHHVDLELSAVAARAQGVLCDDDLLDYGRRLLSDPAVKSAAHELVDLTDVSSDSTVSTSGVRQLTQFWESEYDSIAGGKLAIIAPKDLSYGFSRMYQLLRDDGPDSIQIFRSRDEARRWLLAG